MDTITVRSATRVDLETLFLFEQGVIKAERPFDPTLKPDPINYYDLTAMIDDPNVELVVAELEDEIVGSGYARIENSKPYLQHGKHAYLGFMYVKPDKRSKGIIQKIIKSLKAWISSKNITELRLEVYKDNTAVIRAYEKAGFSQHMIEMRMELEKS